MEWGRECLELNVGVVEGIAVNDLELVGAFEGGGEDERGPSLKYYNVYPWRRAYCVHERGHRKDAEKGEKLSHCNDCFWA